MNIRALTPVAVSLTVLLALSACTSGGKEVLGPDPASKAGASASPTPEPAPKPVLKLNVRKQGVAVDRVLEATVKNGTPVTLRVLGARGEAKGTRVKGHMTETGWAADGRLEPNSRYVVTGQAKDEDGNVQTVNAEFSTAKLSLAQQTYATVSPSGSTVGVGMPVVVRFDVPVTDRANFEKHMTVTSTPAQAGSWHWMSDYEARWRPAKYWKPGSRVNVNVNVNSVSAGKGVFGQYDKSASFRVSSVSKVIKVNMDTHQLRAFENGKLVKQFGISTGKEPEFATRSGVKVIMSKERTHRMSSGTIGIDPNSGQGYDLVVEYAMRVTTSGEFFHAAPWNAMYFGNSNQSHGCTGMSDSDGAWLYNWAPVGTPAEYTGTDKRMTLDNGYGDWNESFKQYKQGSAL